MRDINKSYECAVELMKIDVTKEGYTKQFKELYNKYGIDLVNAVRSDFRGCKLGV